MEHASVAAFARFTLELLALGAPADLVQEANQALGDEINHARLCFGLASAYAGSPIDPGPIALAGALDQVSFFETVSRAIAEACIAETVAAAEAAEASLHATDPEVSAALQTIASDEARHAELGWKFLRWAIAHADLGTRARITELLLRESERVLSLLAGETKLVESEDADVLLEHGVLTSALEQEVRRVTLGELVLPLARSLSACMFDEDASPPSRRLRARSPEASPQHAAFARASTSGPPPRTRPAS